MAKEDGGRLLSKVAKFVRNPLKDWSELDRQQADAPAADTGYSREELKQMIERRQRNDFVRRREFDMLRKLRQRVADSSSEAGGTPSSFQFNNSGKTDGRALTLKKINEIEEQMSQQWWKGRPPGEEAASGSADAAPLAAEHARAYADTAPGTTPPLPSEDAAAASPFAFSPSQLVVETPLEEAAVRFAQADDAGAETVLLEALANGGQAVDDDDTWRGLLDLYRAMGDAEKFGAASTRYVQRFKRPAPAWVSLRALAQSNVRQRAAAEGVDWYCPEQLDREGLVNLTQVLSRAGPVWRIDWRSLRRIDPAAVAPLATLFAHWGDSSVQLRFAGAERLIGVLAEATPVTDRKTDLAWWQLYLAVLRTLHLPEDFELVALHYCITYEIAPPVWQDPQGEYATLDPARADRASGLQILDDAPADETARPCARLAGELTGGSSASWQRLDAELAEEDASVVSCEALIRIDFGAAGALLNWAMARDVKGQKIELVELHRLLLTFLAVVGVADHAELSPRH